MDKVLVTQELPRAINRAWVGAVPGYPKVAIWPPATHFDKHHLVFSKLFASRASSLRSYRYRSRVLAIDRNKH
jgi:hypothetical protein